MYVWQQQTEYITNTIRILIHQYCDTSVGETRKGLVVYTTLQTYDLLEVA